MLFENIYSEAALRTNRTETHKKNHKMRAVGTEEYGGIDAIVSREMPKPEPTGREVLVR